MSHTLESFAGRMLERAISIVVLFSNDHFFSNEDKHLAQRVALPINFSGKFLNDSLLELPTSSNADVLESVFFLTQSSHS